MRAIGRSLVTGGLAAVLLGAAVPAALAHAAYKDSDPADGATVASPPSQITAEFTEPLTSSSSLAVYDPCGNRVDDGNSRVSGYEMSIAMSSDKAGTYSVEFAAQSALDSHVTRGTFEFTSSGGSACPGAEPPPPGTGGGGSGGSGGGPAGGGGSGSGPSGGGVTNTTEGSGPVAGGGSGTGGRNAPGARVDGKRGRPGNGEPNADGRPDPDGRAPVAFENTGDRGPAEPDPWDLPLTGVFMALVLCVMIGAAGGRVYAGIVAPPRR